MTKMKEIKCLIYGGLLMKLFSNPQTWVAMLITLVTVSLVASSGCVAASDVQNTVTASGSTALLPFSQSAQETFEKKYPQITIIVSGGGSLAGITQVAAGSISIGNSDIDLPFEFKDKGLIDYKVAITPFVFIAHPDVKIDNLTQQQYLDILTGKISNWKAIGGKDQKITIFHKDRYSGASVTIKQIVLKGASITDVSNTQESNTSVRTATATTPGSIGYIDASYVNNTVKMLGYNGVKYSVKNISNGKYPLYGFEHMYTKGAPTYEAKTLIDYIASKEFQEVYIEESGFLPMTKAPKGKI
jgi:phosphate transport system substrate-binding protein